MNNPILLCLQTEMNLTYMHYGCIIVCCTRCTLLGLGMDLGHWHRFWAGHGSWAWILGMDFELGHGFWAW